MILEVNAADPVDVPGTQLLKTASPIKHQCDRLTEMLIEGKA